MTIKPPVRVSLNVEWPGGSESETLEIDRTKWDSMSPAERLRMIDEAVADHANDYVGSGWYIADPVDGAAAGQP